MKNEIYEEERNALIPEAFKYANSQVGATMYEKNFPEKKRWSFAWSRIFHKKMNELAKAKGIT